MMKKLVTIAVLASFLSSTTELHEFLKVPHLVMHFMEHWQESSAVSVGEYLHIHYAHDHENHHDDHHDKGCLPFQGNHTSLPSISILYTEAGSLSILPQVVSSSTCYPATEQVESSYHPSIWQPPKIG